MGRGEVGIETEVIAKCVGCVKNGTFGISGLELLEDYRWDYEEPLKKTLNWEELGSGNKGITSLSLNLESVL